MKLIYFEKNHAPVMVSESLQFVDKRGVVFRYDNAFLNVEKYFYGSEVRRYIFYKKSLFLVYCAWQKEDTYSWDSFSSVAFHFESLDGIPLALDRLDQYCIGNSICSYDEYYLFRSSDFFGESKKEEGEVILYNQKTKKHIKFPGDYYVPNIVGDKLLRHKCVDGGHLIAYSLNGGELWDFSYEGTVSSRMYVSHDPLVLESTLVINLLAKSSGGFMSKSYTDGEVYGFDFETGAVKWIAHFDYQVEDLCSIHNKRLIAFSGNTLFEIDAQTGAVIRAMEFDVPLQTRSILLCPFGEYIYISSLVDHFILLVKQSDFSLVRREDVKELGWYLGRRPNVVGDKLFVSIRVGHVFKPTLLIDAQDILAPIDIERGPKRELMVPSEERGPIVLTIESDNLSDILRFAEWDGMDAAQKNGYVGLGRETNQAFDGRVILKLKGCESIDSTELKEKLNILKKRFEYYAWEEFSITCGKNKNDVTFEYQLL